MARTGFYDASQDLYLPKDGLQWSDLGSAPYQTWDSYTTWYKELSSSTELEYTSDIIDMGSNKKIFPLILLTVLRDGATSTSGSFGADFPKIVIEGSVNSDMSSATSVTLTRTSSPNYTSVGSKRYYRVTTTINSGSNPTPQGLRGISISLLTEAIEEVIEGFNTSDVDDGSTVNRTIPTAQTYGVVRGQRLREHGILRWRRWIQLSDQRQREHTTHGQIGINGHQLIHHAGVQTQHGG